MYAATLAHYGVVADPARVRDPNPKGTVENAIGTQATALKGRRFESLQEQNDFLEHWEGRKQSPLSRLGEGPSTLCLSAACD